MKMDSNCKSEILVILDIYWVISSDRSIWRDALKIPFATSKAAHCYVNS